MAKATKKSDNKIKLISKADLNKINNNVDLTEIFDLVNKTLESKGLDKYTLVDLKIQKKNSQLNSYNYCGGLCPHGKPRVWVNMPGGGVICGCMPDH